MKIFSRMLIVVGAVLMLSAAGNDAKDNGYPMETILWLMVYGMLAIVGGVCLERLRR